MNDLLELLERVHGALEACIEDFRLEPELRACPRVAPQRIIGVQGPESLEGLVLVDEVLASQIKEKLLSSLGPT